jgi:hypothetical protein
MYVDFQSGFQFIWFFQSAFHLMRAVDNSWDAMVKDVDLNTSAG